MALAAWVVGDQYRMLISLGRRDLGDEAIRATLAPARGEATATVRRGLDEGVFADHVPAPVIALTLEALLLALAGENAASTWADPAGDAAATALLVVAGVAPQVAALRVREVLRGPKRHERRSDVRRFAGSARRHGGNDEVCVSRARGSRSAPSRLLAGSCDVALQADDRRVQRTVEHRVDHVLRG
jgi:hypothetical protein